MIGRQAGLTGPRVKSAVREVGAGCGGCLRGSRHVDREAPRDWGFATRQSRDPHHETATPTPGSAGATHHTGGRSPHAVGGREQRETTEKG